MTDHPKGLHPATTAILQHFAYDHLPPRLAEISKQVHDLAYAMAPRSNRQRAGRRLDPDPGPAPHRRAPAPPQAGARHTPIRKPQRQDMTGVGYKLYRQVANLAPGGWTSGMRVVAWVIADAASEETRRATRLTSGDLCRLAGMTERGVRKVLEKLAESGYEFRVEHGRDKNGKPIYATPSRDPEYQVPDIFQHMINGAAVAFGLVDSHSQGGTTVPP